MSRKRRNGQSIIHTNTLRPATQDEVALAVKVEANFLDLCGSYRRLTGNDLVPPQDMDRDMLAWRQLLIRHRKGDFRCTDAECKCVQVIAQWTVDVNNQIRNQQFVKPIQWRQ